MRSLILIAALMAGAPGVSWAQPEVVYTFRNVADVNAGASHGFEIQVAATAAGALLGDQLLYLDYDAASFGNWAVGAGRVTVTAKGPFADASRYLVHVNDHAATRLAIAVEYLDPAAPGDGLPVSTTPETVLEVVLDRTVHGTAPSLSFATGLMQGQQYQAGTTAFAGLHVAGSTSPSKTPDWSVDPAAYESTVTLVGAVTLDSGPSTHPDDVLAAFVGDTVRGVATSIDVGGVRLFFLTIHATGDGETVAFRFHDETRSTVVQLDETITFTANGSHGTVAAPFTLTEAASGQILSLSAGWNLVSLTVTPPDAAPGAVFASAGGTLEYVTGFSGGATFFDPDGLPFLNTLTSLVPGRGYWVKVSAAVDITISGPALPDDEPMSLTDGWNLVGYWKSQTRAPSDVFASLITADRLDYVTGFSGGATFFNPTGLPFLNTLTVLQSGRGYWVKVDGAEANFVFKRGGVTPTNRFMFVGGTLPDGFSGQDVLVLTADGLAVGRGTIDHQGRLPALAVYGDDPTTPEQDGALEGDALYLMVDGTRFTLNHTFSADMALRTIALGMEGAETTLPTHFHVDPGYPNPFADRMTIPLGLPEAGEVRMQVYDIQGRRVATLMDGRMAAGAHRVTLSAHGLSAGTYFLDTTYVGDGAGPRRIVQTIQITR